MFARQVEKRETDKPRRSADAAQRTRPAAMKHMPLSQRNAWMFTPPRNRAGSADVNRSLAGARHLDTPERLVDTPGLRIQAQLQVGRVDDPLEREADGMAEQVMSGPAPGALSAAEPSRIGRKCTACEETGNLRRKSAGPDSGGDASPIAHEVLRSPGRPLDAATRAFMEPRFGQDFSGVRVHTDSSAQQSAQGLNANAYTAGHNIVFGAGQFAPQTPNGDRLIAHELSHVVQQTGSVAGQGLLAQRDHKKGTSGAVNPPPSSPAVPAPGESSSRADADVSEMEQFWSAVALAGVTQRAKELTDQAVAKMIKERGPRLKELTIEIDNYDYSYLHPQGDWDGHLALIAERQEIFDAYDPSKEHACEAPTVPGSFIRLPYSTVAAPLSGPPAPFFEEYPPNILPDNATRYGKYGGYRFKDIAVRSSVGDAYAYNIETNKWEVANDLERLARAGYTEIHIATGTHGSAGGAAGGPETEVRFMREDARAIYETMQRHPGLKIIPYNMGDPAQVAAFDGLQALAADGQLPGAATMAAFCFSRTRVSDPNEDPAEPYGSVEVLDGRPSVGMSFTQGGFTALFGAMSIYSGMNDPNRLVGDLKIAGGGAQVLGGASYAIGNAIDSLPAVRWGSRLGEAGGYVTAPLVLYDLYRDMSRKFEPGGSMPVSGEEALADSVETTMKLAGMFFPEAAVGAIALEYAVKPAAGKAAEYVTPTFSGAIGQIYDIPSWRHY
jgi:hypothetical protein